MHTEDELQAIIKEGNSHDMETIAKYVFSDKFYVNFASSLRQFINRAEFVPLADLIQYSFSRSHSANWYFELTKLTNRIKRDPDLFLLNKLIIAFVLNKPHSVNFSCDIIKTMIGYNNTELDRDLVLKVFSQPHSAKWQKYLKPVIARANPELLDLIQRSSNVSDIK